MKLHGPRIIRLIGTLGIESGETPDDRAGRKRFTVPCTGDYDVYKIIVEPGGWLTADGVTFQGDGTAGLLGAGIEIKTNDDLTTIEKQ